MAGKKKRGLQKGCLDTLLTETLSLSSQDISKETEDVIARPKNKRVASAGELIHLAVECLKPGRFQPRRKMDKSELNTLSDSIRAQGVLQPIVVRMVKKGRYEIIAGERRWRAAQLAGLSDVPVVIKDVPDEAAMAIGLVENIQRQDLNPLEEALALERLVKEFGLTHAQVAKVVGKSRPGISNLLRILDLRKDVKDFVDKGQLDLGHAKVLLALQGTNQSQVARIVVKKKLSVRQTEQLISKILNEQKNALKKSITTQESDPDVRRLQSNLSETLGAVVHIVQGNRGGGRLVIQYNSLEELEGILEHIN